MPAMLRTAGGNNWEFAGGNDRGAILVDKLSEVMRLSPAMVSCRTKDGPEFLHRVSVKSFPRKIRWAAIPEPAKSEIACSVGPFQKPQQLALQMARVAQIVVQGAEMKGGLLLHGALAEWKGNGVILAGPAGVGKTTAVGRLPFPWRALSDDAALVVKARDGAYWAHPWPTWSRIGRGATRVTWDVQHAVRLRLICMLEQGKRDKMDELSYLPAISELVDIAGQAFVILANGVDITAYRRINLTRFHNAEKIVKRVPVFRLQASRDGRFWKEIEKHLSCWQDVV
jgi:SynChlorMet cassette protein ScmC